MRGRWTQLLLWTLNSKRACSRRYSRQFASALNRPECARVDRLPESSHGAVQSLQPAASGGAIRLFCGARSSERRGSIHSTWSTQIATGSLAGKVSMSASSSKSSICDAKRLDASLIPPIPAFRTMIDP